MSRRLSPLPFDDARHFALLRALERADPAGQVVPLTASRTSTVIWRRSNPPAPRSAPSRRLEGRCSSSCWTSRMPPAARSDRPPPADAGAALTTQLDADNTVTLARLLDLHGLEPDEAVAVRRRLEEASVSRRPLDEPSSSVLGGLLTGASGELTADFRAGGLTFGGGAVAGPS